MSNAKNRANRQNALRSSGPRTPEGKAASSKNSTKHGIASNSPVVPAFESQADWEAHLSRFLNAMAPRGALETELAHDVAFLTWRLRRVIRYETGEIATAQASAEDDLDHDGTAGNARLSRMCAETVQRLRASVDDDEPVHPAGAWGVLFLLARIVHQDDLELAAACLPDGVAAAEFDAWTVGLLRRAIAVAARRAGMQCSALEGKVECKAVQDQQRWGNQLKRVERALDRRGTARVLPEGDTLERICRYEAHLRRSLWHSLHELQRLQAARLGAGPPLPAALDVNVGLSPGAGPAPSARPFVSPGDAFPAREGRRWAAGKGPVMIRPPSPTNPARGRDSPRPGAWMRGRGGGIGDRDHRPPRSIAEGMTSGSGAAGSGRSALRHSRRPGGVRVGAGRPEYKHGADQDDDLSFPRRIRCTTSILSHRGRACGGG